MPCILLIMWSIYIYTCLTMWFRKYKVYLIYCVLFFGLLFHSKFTPDQGNQVHQGVNVGSPLATERCMWPHTCIQFEFREKICHIFSYKNNCHRSLRAVSHTLPAECKVHILDEGSTVATCHRLAESHWQISGMKKILRNEDLISIFSRYLLVALYMHFMGKTTSAYMYLVGHVILDMHAYLIMWFSKCT